MKAPILRPDGSCPKCVGGWQCDYHSAAGVAADRKLAATLRKASEGLRQFELERICARHELESDEGGTRLEKAERILATETK